MIAIAGADTVGGFEIDATSTTGALYSGTEASPGNDWALGGSQTGVFQLTPPNGTPDVPNCYGSNVSRVQAAGASAFICDGNSDTKFKNVEPEQNIVSPSGKTPDDVWPIKPGNVRPKNDFSHAYTNGVFLDSPCDDDGAPGPTGELNDDLQLRLGGHVGDNEGSHFWGFEFDRTAPGGFASLKANGGASFNLDFNRQQNDLLISFTVPGNANDPVALDVFQVQNNPTQGQPAVFALAGQNSNCPQGQPQGLTKLATNQNNDVKAPPWFVPACDPTATNASNSCRAVRGAFNDVEPPPAGTDNRLPPRDFAEAAVDLTAFNITNPCITSVLFTSRSSHPLEGADIQDVGGGDFPLCAIKSGTKYHDLNADGDRDTGESGIAGWPIFLYADANQDGVLDAAELASKQTKNTSADDATTTDVNEAGQYKFENLSAGKYIACEQAQHPGSTTPPIPSSGWLQSAPLAGAGVTDTCDNGTGNAERGYAFTISGENHPNNDFGNYRNATKSGVKFNDLNADGDRDAGEPGLAGWRIYVDLDDDGEFDAGEPTDLTDADDPTTPNVNELGQYTITGITPSSTARHVREVTQAGWTCSMPSPCFYTETFSSGAQETGNDFGNYQNATKSGVKFNDLNADGDRDAGEPGLAGWRIYVDLDDDGEFDAGEPTDLTDADDPTTPNVNELGQYTITGITPSSTARHVREVTQAGWTCSMPSPCFYTETFSSGAQETGNDFGNFQNTGISGMKFKDADANGEKGAGEIGLSGWVIHLFGPNGFHDSTVTAADDQATPNVDETGRYSFSGLTPGDYVVCEQLTGKPNWVQSFPTGTTCATKTVPNEPLTSLGAAGYSVTTTSGGASPNRDFGNTPLSTITVTFNPLATLPGGGDATEATDITCVDQDGTGDTVGTTTATNSVTTTTLKTNQSKVVCTVTYVDP